MVLFLTFAGALAATPYYVADAPRAPAETAIEPGRLVPGVVEGLDQAGIHQITVQVHGQPPLQVLPGRRPGQALVDLGSGVLAVLGHVLREEGPGVELDVLARDRDLTRPVTVRWEGEDSVHVQVGPAWAGPARRVEDLSAFLERWKLNLESDGTADWQEAELALLVRALALLQPEELEMIRDLPFRRTRKSHSLPSGEPAVAAYRFTPDQGYRFEFYRVDTSERMQGFIGDPAQPRSRALAPILHELGHAIADHGRRQQLLPVAAHLRRAQASYGQVERARQRLVEDPLDQAARRELEQGLAVNQQASSDLRALGLEPQDMEVVRQWQEAVATVELELLERVGDRPPITGYAATTAVEHFAELFAYTHLDPAAMLRVYPDAAAWLISGDYRAAIEAEQAPWRAEAPSEP